MNEQTADAEALERRREQEARLAKTWARPRGWRYFSAVNNSIVGLWYTTVAFCFFLFAGVLALLMRTQLAVPENDFVSAETYDQLFTLHGSVMMFLFAVPIFEAFAILILPPMLGTRDMPFPRLSAFGFWCYVIGGTFVCGSIFFGIAPSGGWFMYPPLTTQFQPGLGPDVWLLGLSFIEIASIAAAIELLVGVLRTRAPGMRINMIPLYAWYMIVVAGMILFAFPPLIAGDLLFELERAFDWPFFDPARGGDPLLWQHLFWIFGHPEVYIIFLPSIALAAMIVPTFAQQPMVGYSFIVLAAVGVGFLSFGLWVHHMFTTGLPTISLAFFSAASEAVVIPTAVQIFCFLATILVGHFVASVPMLFVSGALAIFVIGGLTGVMVAVTPFDFQAHDTYFIVAHLHYVLIGGGLFPVLAGLYYFLPAATGKKLSERSGKWVFWLMFLGFNIGFFPMHVSGLMGMPRRVFTYREGLGFDLYNLISTLGAYVIGAGVLLLVLDVIRCMNKKMQLPRNPWNAGTLEWIGEMPTRPWGLRCIPDVKSRYPLWDQPGLMRDFDEGRFYLPDAEELRRETLVTSTVDANPLQCFRLPGPSYLSMIAAIFTAGIFILATFHLWKLAVASAGLATATILVWLWTGTAQVPEKPKKDIGLGVSLPLYVAGSGAIGWWGLLIAMIGDATAFASLIFSYFYYWTVNPEFPTAADAGPGLLWPGLACAAFLGAWLLALLGRKLNRAGALMPFRLLLTAAAALTVAGGWMFMQGPRSYGMDPTAHVYPAMVWVVVVWNLLHAGVGLIMLLYCLARSFTPRLTPAHDVDIWNVTLYWHFLAATVAISAAVIALFPTLT